MKNLLLLILLVVILIFAGCVNQDTPIVPTSLPTTAPPAPPTTVPTTVQTTVSTTVPTRVPTPVPKTVVGCWRLEHSVGNTTIVYTYDLKADGTGWMYGSKTTPLTSESMKPDSITWSKDPYSAEVTILSENPTDPADINRWVLTYNENADILDGGEKGQVPLIFKRVAC